MSSESNEQRIWQVVALIPAGRVATYGQVAALAGLPRGARLVGRVLSRLPEGSKVPWFRVINARGDISFPVDSPAYQRQRTRLEADGVTFINGRINLNHYRWQPCED